MVTLGRSVPEGGTDRYKGPKAGILRQSRTSGAAVECWRERVAASEGALWL